MKKKKLATVWLGGCSGCHMSLLDIDERILDLAKLVDIVKSPIVDGKEFPDRWPEKELDHLNADRVGELWGHVLRKGRLIVF